MNIQSTYSLVNALKSVSGELDVANLKVSTGKAFQTAGDNPQAWMESNTLSLNISDSAVKLSTLGTVSDALTKKETVLDQMQEVTRRAAELATLSNNGALATVSDLATEAKALYDQFISLANSKDYNGNYIFSGVATNQSPLAMDGSGNYFYAGASTETTVSIENASFSLNTAGGFLVGIANTLKSFSTELNSGSKTSSAVSSAISASLDSINVETARVGAIGKRAESISTFVSAKSDIATTRFDEVTGADMAQALSQQQAAATQYDTVAALLAKNINQKSMFDLLFN